MRSCKVRLEGNTRVTAMINARASRVSIAMVVIIVAISIISIPFIVMLGQQSIDASRKPSMAFEPYIETSGCDCYPVTAELWEIDEYNATTFFANVTSIIRWRDGWWVSFNNYYVLHVIFNKNLTNGCIIRLYARYGTTAPIKAVIIETMSFEAVGGGDVNASWGYYDLAITSLASPSNEFYITLNRASPPSNRIRIDKVSCRCIAPVIPWWREPGIGTIITNYTFNFNYLVTASTTIDASEVYLDLVIYQTIYNQLNGSPIVSYMLEQSIVHVPTVGDPYLYISHVYSMPSRTFVGVDNITISIDVDVIVKGKLLSSNDWIVSQNMYESLKNFSAWWY